MVRVGEELSIAKAREAQKRFEENKKQVEAAKKKAEEAAKKAKNVQQRIKETQATFKVPIIVTGGIAAVAAAQIGSLRGKLVAQIQNQVLTVLNKFSSECPDSKELQKIIKTRNTLINHLTSFEKRIDKYSDVAKKITLTVVVVSNLIKVITSIPVPTAIIPPMVGGIGIPINILTKYSNLLIKLNKTLDKLLGEAAAITAIIITITPVITNLKNRLEAVDLAIQQCSVQQPADLNQIIVSAQPPENTGSEGVPNEDYLYKGYTLLILEDTNTVQIAPRRYAIATDKGGIVRLKGETSFSSNTQVLLDEIKFKIDNQLA